SPARAGAMLPGCSVFSLGGKDQSNGPRCQRAFPVPSLLPVSEINHCTSGPVTCRTGGGLQVPARGWNWLQISQPPSSCVLWSLCLATRSEFPDCIENE